MQFFFEGQVGGVVQTHTNNHTHMGESGGNLAFIVGK